MKRRQRRRKSRGPRETCALLRYRMQRMREVSVCAVARSWEGTFHAPITLKLAAKSECLERGEECANVYKALGERLVQYSFATKEGGVGWTNQTNEQSCARRAQRRIAGEHAQMKRRKPARCGRCGNDARSTRRGGSGTGRRREADALWGKSRERLWPT